MNRLKRLRIGVMCDGENVTRWQAKCLSEALAVEGVEVALIIVNATPAPLRKAGSRLRGLLSDPLLLWKVYQRAVLRRKAMSIRPVDLATLLDAQRVDCAPQRVGKYRDAFLPKDLEQIRSHDLDVILRFGFGILTGDILQAARFGIWSFHHGDLHKFRGAPPGFWEIVRRDHVTGAVLQRLTERLDSGVVLDSAWIRTSPAYVENLDRLYLSTTHLIANALRRCMSCPESLADLSAVDAEGPIYKFPRNADMVRFLWSSTAWKIGNRLSALFRHQQWAVGIVNQSCESIVESQRIDRPKWLSELKGTFLADPFAVDQAGPDSITVAAEAYDWRRGVGRIVQLRCDRDGTIIEHADAINPASHLSYPYTFRVANDLFCAPESAAAGATMLYRWENDKRRWEPVDVLFPFPAIDPTLVEHDGRWWLFCTSAETGANEALQIWHSESYRGPWEPHLLNPVKLDVRSSRPAGTPFRMEGALMRPAQDCSLRYGAAITVNKVVELTVDSFREEPVARIEPDRRGPYNAGLHTMNPMANGAIIDGARMTFSIFEFFRALKHIALNNHSQSREADQ